MKTSYFAQFMVWAFMTVGVWGQTWKSGATTVTLSDGTLTVSGNGAMDNYDPINDYPSPPWWDDSTANLVMAVIVEDGVTSIGDGAFAGYKLITSATIGKDVKTIGEYAFLACFAMTSFTIPRGVVSIGGAAFAGCINLTSITIPNSVKTIGGEAFAKCTSLTIINVATDNNNYSSNDGVLFNKSKTVLITYPKGRHGAYVIPPSVTNIGDRAFGHCVGITSVTIPISVKTIGREAFEVSPPSLISIISLNPNPPAIVPLTFRHLSSDVCLYVPVSSINAYKNVWKELDKRNVVGHWKGFKCIKELKSAPKGD